MVSARTVHGLRTGHSLCAHLVRCAQVPDSARRVQPARDVSNLLAGLLPLARVGPSEHRFVLFGAGIRYG